MYNCSDDLIGYHDDEVTLSNEHRSEMRERRDANRVRLKDGLKKKGKPLPYEFKSQGSYAMRTMTQHPENAYDIDDGAYFEKAKLLGDRGAELTALAARQMVRDAVDDGSFKKAPEVREKCVRIHYDLGFHVDIPIYRKVESKDALGKVAVHYELAAADWKRSDARDVTTWFERENEKSLDKENGGQIRRITRLAKRFAKSRPSWEGQILSGFGITVLVAECYRGDAAREDIALYETLRAMKERLDRSLVVKHPVTPDETITKGTDDARARLLREKLGDFIGWMAPAMDPRCDRESALKCWDQSFRTKYFVGQLDEEESSDTASAASKLSIPAVLKTPDISAARPAVQKEGGGRYA